MGQSRPGTLPKLPAGMRCPICRAATDAELRPFCSTRCADVDLASWFNGAYAIPGGQQDADEDGDETQVARETGDTKLDDGGEE